MCECIRWVVTQSSSLLRIYSGCHVLFHHPLAGTWGWENTLLKEGVTIAAKASMRSITASVAVASNLQLVCRDVVLDHLLLNQSTASWARTAPFAVTHLMGPDPNQFTEVIPTGINLRLEGKFSWLKPFRNFVDTKTRQSENDNTPQPQDQWTIAHSLANRLENVRGSHCPNTWPIYLPCTVAQG